MNIEVQQPPHHSQTCRAPDIGELDPQCAGCDWMHERFMENIAWQRWMDMVPFYPRGPYEGRGCG